MRKYKLCNSCHIVFDKTLNYCPSCGKEISEESKVKRYHGEGTGRRFGAGGSACDYCPHCYGSGDWCPLMDD